jgi:hypothetical protein
MVLIVASILAALGFHSFLHAPIRVSNIVTVGSNSVVPKSYPIVPATFFGMSVLNQHGVIPPLSYGTTRTWDAYPGVDWADTNPLPGRYDFKSLDVFFAAANKSKDVVFTLGRTPQWASSLPDAKNSYGLGQCAPPENMATWDAYVRAVAKYVHGRTHYWELWNEPDDKNFYCGDISKMVEMSKHAHSILKEVDPQAILISPPVTGGPGPKWLESFLAEGGGSYVDVIAFHGYWSASAEDIESVIASYQVVLHDHALDKKPLWDTEVSWAGSGNLPAPAEQDQAAYIAKSYLLHWSQGVERAIWYAYDVGPKGGGMLSSNKEMSAPAKAYKETYRWMQGATLVAPCIHDSHGTWTCSLRRNGDYRAEVMWNSSSVISMSPDTRFTEYYDLAGSIHHLSGENVTIGFMPVLFENRAIPPQ